MEAISSWLTSCFNLIKQLPRYLIPKYFAVVVMEAAKAAEHRAVQSMSPFVIKGSSFIKVWLYLC